MRALWWTFVQITPRCWKIGVFFNKKYILCSLCVTGLNHSLEANLHFGNKQNHAYQYFNLTGVLEKRRLLSCWFLGQAGHANMKDWGSSSIPKSLRIIVESYSYSSKDGTCFKHRARVWPGSDIASHVYRDDDHITHYEGHWQRYLT